MTKRKGIDFYPTKKKTQIAKDIFGILGITPDANDFSEETVSGGGGTVTKQGWGKIMRRLEEMSNERDVE